MLSWLQDGGGSCLLSQGTVHGQAPAGNAWWGAVKLLGLIQATGPAVGFAASRRLFMLVVKLLFASTGAQSFPLSPRTYWDAVSPSWDRAVSRGCHPGPECLLEDREWRARAGAMLCQENRQMQSRCLIISTVLSDPWKSLRPNVAIL